MYTITVNGSSAFKTDIKLQDGKFSGVINGQEISGDLLKINDYQFHLLYKNKSYSVDLLKLNSEEKSIVLKINSAKYNLSLKDKYDELLHQLGMDNLNSKKVSEVKAPMPGMVLNVMVEEGAEVKKGDVLIVLEAMKMENILKSPSDGTVKKIHAIKGSAVEKNQILIQF